MVELDNQHKKVIFVIGPTATGKSSWALESCLQYGGSIINIDSVQFYKDLVIGSASPTEDEKKSVPHYFYNDIEAPQEMTAGIFIRRFYELIKNPNLKFPLFIVGGTGFYIQALEIGLFDIEPIPKEIREQLEYELKQSGSQILHAELMVQDPHSKIHPNDHYRLVRALEIIRHTGKKPTELNSEKKNKNNAMPFPFIKLGFQFEKSILEKRVQLRSENMLNQGIIDEVQTFKNNGFEAWSPLHSVGYKQTLQFLNENKTKEWLKIHIQQATMQLIKKQKTWFKRDSSILWSEHSKALIEFLHRD